MSHQAREVRIAGLLLFGYSALCSLPMYAQIEKVTGKGTDSQAISDCSNISSGCDAKRKENREEKRNYEDCFADGWRAYGRERGLEKSRIHMHQSRTSCPREDAHDVIIATRDYVSYVPTLFYWASEYRLREADPDHLFQWIWGQLHLEKADWEAYLGGECDRLADRLKEKDLKKQIAVFKRGLRALPPGARRICKRFLAWFESLAEDPANPCGGKGKLESIAGNLSRERIPDGLPWMLPFAESGADSAKTRYPEGNPP